jgi:alpha-glucosidase
LAITIREESGGFDLMLGERLILRHRPGQPAFRLARGAPEVRMLRGNFDMRDDPRPLPPLKHARVGATALLLSVEEGGEPLLSVEIETHEGLDAFAIRCSDPSIDRLWAPPGGGAGEHVWGGGEQMSYLDLKGRRFPMWTSEPGVGRDKSTALTRLMDKTGMAGGDYWTTNYPQPTFLSSRGYVCHLDSSAYSVLDFRDEGFHEVEVWQTDVRLLFFAADDLIGLVGKLSDHFGRQPELPDWAISGAIVGLKDGARSFDRLDAILDAGAAVTGLWCEDWVGIRQTSFGRRLFWDWRWNPDRYPDLPDRMAALAERGIRFLGYVNPYLAVDGAQFREAAAGGHLALRRERDEPYLVDFGEFDCGVVDFTRAETRDWFAERIVGREMLDFGLSGWMADFGEYLPTDLRLHDGSDPMLLHNRWPVLWAEVNARAVASRGRTGDALFFMRAGFSGVQAHCPLLWAGDQCVDWTRHDGIGTTITAALSAGLLGNAYSHSDLGGYTSLHGNIRTAELIMRWSELAAFTPVMRSHEGNRPDDNLQVDSTRRILAHFASMSLVHAALAPYVRHLCREAAATGLPAQRPLFLHYPADRSLYAVQDQYLYGADMLVAPVIEEGAAARTVILPGGHPWIHLWSGATFAPETHEIEAPLGRPPVFYRPDSAFAALFESLRNIR